MGLFNTIEAVHCKRCSLRLHPMIKSHKKTRNGYTQHRKQETADYNERSSILSFNELNVRIYANENTHEKNRKKQNLSRL